MFYEPRRHALLCANVGTVQLCIIKDRVYIKASLNIYSFNCRFQLGPHSGTSWWSTSSLWLLRSLQRFTEVQVSRGDASRPIRNGQVVAFPAWWVQLWMAVTQTGIYWFEFLFFKVCLSELPSYVWSALEGHSPGFSCTSRREPVLEEKGKPSAAAASPAHFALFIVLRQLWLLRFATY